MNKRTRHNVTVLTLTILLLAGLLCGCIEKPSEGNAGGAYDKFTGELEQDVTIQVLENDTAIERGYFQELLDAFNETYADYGIVAVDANMDQLLDLANDGPYYGYGPDVLYQANDALMRYVEGRHILPLPVEKMSCYDAIPQTAWDAYRSSFDGSDYIYGIPVNIQAPVLFYRKDLLPDNWETAWDENQNQTPDMLESWNAMYAYSLSVRENNPDKFGYMKSLFDPYFSLGYLLSYGGYIFGDDNTNPKDIGLAAGEAEKGVNVIRQQASMMNEWCIDDTITTNSYAKLADGTYFATMTTPDVYTTFLSLLAKNYEDTMGIAFDEAMELAKENLIMTDVPKLPASGDLTETSPELIGTKMMGGINGYAISAYTKAPNACFAFVEFASTYEMMMLRSEMLGIAPARSDAAQDSGELSATLFSRLEEGNIVIMPSITEITQVWTPAHTFFADVAKDAYRKEGEQKYTEPDAMKAALKAVDKQIYDAIFTLSGD